MVDTVLKRSLTPRHSPIRALNHPTSMDDAGSNDTEQDQSRMTSHDSAALAYISAAVDSLCGVARKHGHMVVSFESRGYKVVLGKSNAD